MTFSVNHPILFVLAGLIIAVVMGQSVYFLAKALKRSKDLGMDQTKIRKTIQTALFGGLGVAFISKNWKLAIAPVLLMLVLFIFVPALNAGTVGIMVPVAALFTIAVGRIMYKKGVL